MRYAGWNAAKEDLDNRGFFKTPQGGSPVGRAGWGKKMLAGPPGVFREREGGGGSNTEIIQNSKFGFKILKS